MIPLRPSRAKPYDRPQLFETNAPLVLFQPRVFLHIPHLRRLIAPRVNFLKVSMDDLGFDYTELIDWNRTLRSTVKYLLTSMDASSCKVEPSDSGPEPSKGRSTYLISCT